MPEAARTYERHYFPSDGDRYFRSFGPCVFKSCIPPVWAIAKMVSGGLTTACRRSGTTAYCQFLLRRPAHLTQVIVDPESHEISQSRFCCLDALRRCDHVSWGDSGSVAGVCDLDAKTHVDACWWRHLFSNNAHGRRAGAGFWCSQCGACLHRPRADFCNVVRGRSRHTNPLRSVSMNL